jgi:hypothetical protein
MQIKISIGQFLTSTRKLEGLIRRYRDDRSRSLRERSTRCRNLDSVLTERDHNSSYRRHHVNCANDVSSCLLPPASHVRGDSSAVRNARLPYKSMINLILTRLLAMTKSTRERCASGWVEGRIGNCRVNIRFYFDRPKSGFWIRQDLRNSILPISFPTHGASLPGGCRKFSSGHRPAAGLFETSLRIQ